MVSRLNSAIGLVFAGLAQAAIADDAGLSEAFSSCMDKSNGVTTTMLECIGSETKAQDARFNTAYKAVMAQCKRLLYVCNGCTR